MSFFTNYTSTSHQSPHLGALAHLDLAHHLQTHYTPTPPNMQLTSLLVLATLALAAPKAEPKSGDLAYAERSANPIFTVCAYP